jgi:hypothetical protein
MIVFDSQITFAVILMVTKIYSFRFLISPVSVKTVSRMYKKELMNITVLNFL